MRPMNPIERYFNAEKSESLLFVLVGVIAIAFATYFFIKIKQPYFNGITYPLTAIALIQITVGIFVYYGSSKEIVKMNFIVQNDKSKVKTEEIPRMNIVHRSLIINFTYIF